jgi:hypothetical protein
MPVEGNWERQQTPLRRLSRRERRLFQAIAAALLVATAVVVLLALLQAPPRAHAGCIEVTGSSTLGAANYRVCGADRRTWCRQEAAHDDPLARAVQARCRALGLSPRSAPAGAQ